MSVELDPAELGFRRPFTQEVSQTLRLSNPNSDPVAFKVKTTAPKQYCVRPNSGRIESGQHVEVQVLLQAMKEDLPPDAKCRDKFLVQSVAVKADNETNVSQIWSNIEQNAKSSIQEKKIRVIFLPADGDAAAGAGAAATASAATNGVKGHDEEPASYSSPNASTVTPQKSGAAEHMSTPGTSSIPTTQDDIKRQLEEAKAQISRLQGQVQEGLRQRKPQEAAEKAVNSVQRSLQNAPAPGGVPVQIVAALCLLVFLIAWLFF
ncbi:PapD-like protein [Neohortaea acidophila]|uniref:PapD-like protein n=1 Tax=Neohortaea acidophila TaxID=245834 RepID=A0A6A6PIU3_9PEZI|nr:PapD-like protein [Neohortaea acidophila]KAF2479835.1 PapD-like protein [Neohortaea acidophila]